MATYKLIPTSYYYVNTNTYAYRPDNALADTTSTTATSLRGMDDSVELSRWFQLIFDEQIPNDIIIDSVEVKIRIHGQYASAYPMSAKINNDVFASGSFGTVDSIITLTPKEEFDIQTLAGTSRALIQIYCERTNSFVYVYGAEINIEYHLPINKIIYGNETLIDLTSDTVTASDVAVGKTVHLPSGIQATGSYLSSPLKATATTTDSTNKTVSFTVTKEPSWFLLVCADATSTRSYRILYYMYNGENVHFGRSRTSSTYGQVEKVTSASVTFAYSNNTLTFTAPSSATNRYFGAADWELYYL